MGQMDRMDMGDDITVVVAPVITQPSPKEDNHEQKESSND